MLIGIVFLSISIFIYIKENYDIDNVGEERVFSKKKDIVEDGNYRYRILISIFSLVLGIFRILSSIIY
ncbi:hypothetical protein CIW83_12465 [Tissierella sp. P1]|uniref:hypothetical protein n=1 Tax=unclassified Tissierella TaxID=2638726 RepID=UPI000BA11EEB|nr:hypothetical protein [Tissierella sp. P1]OZV11849.1 hypothetical protein CIW83_12465 [Tissierella sp. P1]